jgi:hypothetical protein
MPKLGSGQFSVQTEGREGGLEKFLPQHRGVGLRGRAAQNRHGLMPLLTVDTARAMVTEAMHASAAQRAQTKILDCGRRAPRHTTLATARKVKTAIICSTASRLL